MVKAKHARAENWDMRHRLNQHKLNALLMRNVRVFMIVAVMVIIGICMPVDQLYLALIAHGLNKVVLFKRFSNGH